MLVRSGAVATGQRSVLAHAWATRARARPGSRAWAELWYRRVVRLPAMWHLERTIRRLRKGGAVIADGVSLGDVAITGPLGGLRIGEGTALDKVAIRLAGAVTIGKGVAINNGVTIIPSGHDTNSPGWELLPRDIVIDDHAWIGTDAIIIGPCRIGVGAVVSAGAVVGRDVPDRTVVFGNPARAVGTRDVETFDYSPSERWPMWRAWWGLKHADQLRDDREPPAAEAPAAE